MKLSSLPLSLLMVTALSTTSCVTTRSQMNEGRNAAPVVENAPGTTSTIESYGRSQPTRVQQQGAVGSYSLDETKAAVAALTGRVEELELRLAHSGEHSEAFKSLSARVDAIEKKLAEPPPTPTPVPVKDYFKLGKQQFAEGNYEEAADAFDEYNKNPSPKNLEEGIYLKGESYFKIKKYKKAIVEFSKFPEKFPKSAYHPKALMRIGESFEGLGMKEDAKAFYTDLYEKFPKTPEGKAARKRVSGKKK